MRMRNILHLILLTSFFSFLLVNGEDTPLAKYTKEAKEKALQNMRENKPQTLVVGNEAGDLDSVISSITLSYLMKHFDIPAVQKKVDHWNAQDKLSLNGNNVAPVVQFTRDGQKVLHPEVVAVLQLAGINHDDLLHLEDFTVSTDGKVILPEETKLALVDHNQKLWRWPGVQPFVVIDHHPEGNSVQPSFKMITTKAASTCAVIASLYQKQIQAGQVPKEIVNLLLLGLVQDTHNLRYVRGNIDLEMYQMLFTKSDFNDQQYSKLSESIKAKVPDSRSIKLGRIRKYKDRESQLDAIEGVQKMESVYKDLNTLTDNIANLNIPQQLARDTKSLHFYSKYQSRSLSFSLPILTEKTAQDLIDKNTVERKFADDISTFMNQQDGKHLTNSNIMVVDFGHKLLIAKNPQKLGDTTVDKVYNQLVGYLENEASKPLPSDDGYATHMSFFPQSDGTILVNNFNGSRRQVTTAINHIMGQLKWVAQI